MLINIKEAYKKNLYNSFKKGILFFMKLFKTYLLPLLFIAFMLLGLFAFLQAKPSPKNERIYTLVQQFSPYYLDKRLGGLTIKSKTDKNFKEKPTNMTLFKEFERLEKMWAKKHLKLQNSTLLVVDENLTMVKKIPIKNEQELLFIHNYYEIR